jgi:hypothetical protein
MSSEGLSPEALDMLFRDMVVVEERGVGGDKEGGKL